MNALNRLHFILASKEFDVPESVKKAAQRGLDLRAKMPPSKQGGLSPSEAKKQGIQSGVTRAKKLINNTMTRADVESMYKFFQRNDRFGKLDKDSKGYQSYLQWGGASGSAWAKRMWKKIQKEKTSK